MMEGGREDIPDLFEARAALILNLRQQGITDALILRAFETVPHEAFIPEQFGQYAYRESSLPIACGQSITSPAILAGLVNVLTPDGAGKVLEVGTGSGYASAILSLLAKRVFTVDRYRPLVVDAQRRWDALGYTNIVGLHEDGLSALPSQAPFDRILLTGSVETPPEPILDALADGGIAVMAVGNARERQTVMRFERIDDVVEETEHGAVRLAPLVRGRSRML